MDYELTLYIPETDSEGKETKTYKNVTLSLNTQTDALGCGVVKLVSLKYQKQIYQPGYVEAYLQILKKNSTDSLPSVDKLLEVFGGVRVDLCRAVEQNAVTSRHSIASKYYVFEVIPEYKTISSNTSVYTTLKIYSPDKYLTIEKYCQVFVTKKLGEEIFAKLGAKVEASKSETNPSGTPSGSDGSNDSDEEVTLEDRTVSTLFKEKCNSEDGFKINTENLKHLRYSLNGTVYEYIQPYLVQYNESIYDLLVRTANRCGEFLFYENGEFYLGLPKSTAQKIGEREFSSLTYHRFSEETELDEEYTWHYNYDKEREEIEKAYGPARYYDFEGPAEEFLEKVQRKGGLDGWQDEALYPEYAFVSAMTSALGESTLSDMIVTFGTEVSTAIIEAQIRVNYVNGKYNKNQLDGFKSKKDQIDSDKVEEVSQFSSFLKQNLTVDFYAKVRKNERLAERGGIHVNLSNNYKNLGLGATITVAGSSEEYIITQISGCSDSKKESLEIDAVLWTKKESSTDSGTGTGTGSGSGTDEVLPPYPFPLASGTVRKSQPQLAFVADNDDPLRQNRVRLRYPWQGKDDEPSPWVRMTRPVASKDAGFNFKPSKDDEVLVDYENGNIERPYVIGSLYSPTTVPPGTSIKGTHHTIASNNGHTIHFSDPKDSKSFAAGFVPVIKFINTFIPWGSDLTDFGSKGLAGGIEMYDNYGMYSFAMSSDRRAVEISSPLGKVSIDAFTGISINAPNGNVSITGKNVSIKAGNKLTLQSGVNIDDDFYQLGGLNERGSWKKGAKNTLAGVGKSLVTSTFDEFVKPLLCDLSLIRTIAETFLKPVGGTMLIKSHRYIHLEAGGGKVKRPLAYYGTKRAKVVKKEAENKKNKESQRLMSALLFATTCKGKFEHFINTYQEDVDRINALCRSYSETRSRVINNPENQPAEYDTGKQIISKGLKGEKLETKSFAIKKVNNYPRLDDSLYGRADNLWSETKRMHDSLTESWEEMSISVNNLGDAADRKLFDTLCGKLSGIKKDMSLEKTHWLMNPKTGEDGVDFKKPDTKALYRKFFGLIINVLVKEKAIAIDSDKSGDWDEYIDSISAEIEDNFFMEHLKKDLLGDAIGFFKEFKDNHVWDPQTKGEILFSDKEGEHTLSFGEPDGGHAQLTSVQNATENSMVASLRDLFKNKPRNNNNNNAENQP